MDVLNSASESKIGKRGEEGRANRFTSELHLKLLEAISNTVDSILEDFVLIPCRATACSSARELRPLISEPV